MKINPSRSYQNLHLKISHFSSYSTMKSIRRKLSHRQANEIYHSSSIWNSNLPGELLIQILLRLPVKSLLQFRSISKPWLSLLLNSKFIKAHFNFTANKNPSLIIDNLVEETTKTFISLIHLKSLKNPIDLTQYFVISPLSEMLVVGSCNGIICLTFPPLHYLIYLWNPSTKQLKELPVSNMCCFANASLWFGFDPNTIIFKFVRVSDTMTPKVRAEVYSASLDLWSKIQVELDCGRLNLSSVIQKPRKAIASRVFHYTKSMFLIRGSKQLLAC